MFILICAGIFLVGLVMYATAFLFMDSGPEWTEGGVVLGPPLMLISGIAFVFYALLEAFSGLG